MTILLISSLCLYKWTWPSWPDISDSLNTYISVPITVSFGLLPSFHRAWSLHWKIIQLTTVYVWWLPCVNCKYWLTCGFTLLEHTSFDNGNGREGNVCQRESLVNMSRPIWVLKIVLIKIISHSTTWLLTWTCKDTFSWTALICVFRFSFYVNYLPHWFNMLFHFCPTFILFITIITWILTDMNWTNMTLQITLCFSLIFTLITRILQNH